MSNNIIKKGSDMLYEELLTIQNKNRVKTILIRPIVDTIKEWIFPYLITILLLFIIILIICIQCLIIIRTKNINISPYNNFRS